MPQVMFPGDIHVIDSMFHVKEAVRVLTMSPVVGFDTETRPSFRKGVVHKTALIQISTLDECFLFRTCKIGLPAVLADYLAKRGIATLRYDDRGVFKSQGSLEGNTTEVNARDAEGWLDCLRDMQKRGELGSVGILGHSEGGLIAFILAGEGKVDFVVSMAGPATDGKTVSMDQAMGIIRLQEEAGQLSFEAAEQQRQQLNEDMVLASIRSQYGDNSWMDYFLKFDPAPSIQKITCPVMALNGMKDFQVDAKHNLGLLRELLPKNDKHLIKEYYGLNHLFQPCSTGLYAEYGQIETTMSEEVMKDIADWILRIK